jgi:hypothetical protein
MEHAVAWRRASRCRCRATMARLSSLQRGTVPVPLEQAGQYELEWVQQQDGAEAGGGVEQVAPMDKRCGPCGRIGKGRVGARW